MADTPEQVLSFLNELAEKSKPLAERDIVQLRRFAQEQGGDDLQAWDVAYYSEKLRQQDYALSQEELSTYIPAERVSAGRFYMCHRMFNLDIVSGDSVDTGDTGR